MIALKTRTIKEPEETRRGEKCQSFSLFLIVPFGARKDNETEAKKME